jgi:hypothetical protein
LGTLQNQPLASFVRFLRSHHGVKTFVETGTYLGAGTAFGVEVFPEVFSIEVSPEFHGKAKASLEGTHARLILGDSRVELPKIVGGLTGPAVFWLDGHAGGGHFGPDDDCPLIEELTAIAASPHEHFILVDDARAFLAPPPPPFDPDKWPDLAQVLDTVRSRTPYYCVAIADTLICVPPAAKGHLRAFCNAIRPNI